jgi:uncharacterized protein (DUF2141 family)
MLRRIDRLVRAIPVMVMLILGAVGPARRPPAPAATRPAATRPAAAADTATLTIEVIDLRGHKGQLIFGVFTSADGFPTQSGKSVNWQIKPADADKVIFTAELPPGAYGASVLHDENDNGGMDKNLIGIPKEGYGVTNNPKPRRRAATFDESRFTLPPEGATLTISVQYF